MSTLKTLIKENCPYGCPCDNYECAIPDKKSILVLSTYTSLRPSVLINYDGGVNRNLNFELGNQTEVYGSCSALLNGEFYVFGGSNERDQVR